MSTSPQRENESTREYVTRLMEEAVALKGEDYVYEQLPTCDPDAITPTTCYYVWDDQPSCIVGHVLHAAGVPLDRLRVREGIAAHMVVRAEAPDDWDTSLEDALDAAQGLQDSGGTWGQALAAFKKDLGIE